MIFQMKIMFSVKLGLQSRKQNRKHRFGPMIGCDAVKAKRNDGLSQRYVLCLKDPDPLLITMRPFCDGELVGYLTSGNYGHHLAGAIGLGWRHGWLVRARKIS